MPATFQWLIEVVLTGLLWKKCFVYIDDVLVSSPEFESHLAHLQEVFDGLRNAGLRFKTKKCRFLKPTVSYLGHLVTSEGIQPDTEKASRVIGYPAPTDIKVRRFLGLASYYRRFCARICADCLPPAYIAFEERSPFLLVRGMPTSL